MAITPFAFASRFGVGPEMNGLDMSDDERILLHERRPVLPGTRKTKRNFLLSEDVHPIDGATPELILMAKEAREQAKKPRLPQLSKERHTELEQQFGNLNHIFERDRNVAITFITDEQLLGQLVGPRQEKMKPRGLAILRKR